MSVDNQKSVQPSPLLAEAVKLLKLKPNSKYKAIDAGCGYGRDTKFLLERGFFVTSFDKCKSSISEALALLEAEARERAQLHHCCFEEFKWEKCIIINASFSLFFCKEEEFEAVWERIKKSLPSGGIFTGQILGNRDSWAMKPNISAFDLRSFIRLKEGFNLEYFKENYIELPEKNWHVYHVILRKA